MPERDNAAYTAEQVRVVHHPANDAGRDLVVGDLHGYRALLDALLERVGFDPARDRLFSVGDLTDRGPESERCLELLGEPWFLPVLGNHDVLLTAAVDGRRDPPLEPAGVPALGGAGQIRTVWAFNGGDWALPLLEDGDGVAEVLRTAAERLARVPHVRVVGSGAERFQVVHAELVDPLSGALLGDAEVDALDGTDIRSWCGPEGVFALPLIWSRMLMEDPSGPEPGPAGSLTVCGHTPVPEPLRRAGHLGIDTGACMGGSLTLLEPRTGAVHSLPAA